MSNNYYALFFIRGNTKVRLPVNPEKLPVEKDNANDDYNVLKLGPIMVPRIPELRVGTISSFFPGRQTPSTLLWDRFHEPEFYIQFFLSAMDEKAVITYLPVRTYENGDAYARSLTGFDALVTKFTYEERGGETGDFYYTLEITEYRDYAPVPFDIKPGATADSPAVATVKKTRSIPEGQLYAGAICTANGRYCYTSYGDGPYGTANGQRVVIDRIVDWSRPTPVHITTAEGSSLGWISKDALQVVTS